MQEELLQFRLQKVWRLVDLPKGKHVIGIKWVYRNKKDERGIVVRNKARLVAQDKALYGLHQAPRAWYETLSTYLIENGFRRGIIDKTLFIKKDKGDILLVQVYVDDIIFGSTKKSLCTEFESLMHKRFQMSSIGELTFFLGLQVKQKDDGIFISQDKYVADILKKFDFSLIKIASTLMETNKALIKDEKAKDVDVHLYKSMIGSLMYLTASRPDIMFAVCACARFQVTLKVSHLHAVKRIFRYLKGQPKLGLWYPRDSLFDLESFSNSDYAGASLDRKSTTGGCQFLGKRLISWQCKKQTIVANSTTEAEYVVAANCYGQAFDVSSDEFGVKTGSCKVNAAWQDLVLLGEINDVKQIHATVDGKTVVISESSVRSDLHFNDEDGITCLTNTAIFENLALMGYESDSDKLTFQKALFSPQWKYLIHTILHCLSSKSTSWNEFSTNIASAVICLATGQKFNFSKLIFDEPFNDTYETPKHTKKVFTNMKRKGKDFSGRVTPLFASMLAPPVVRGKADEAIFKECDDRVVRATTTAASLDAAHASGVNTPGSNEERIEHQELMDNIPPTPHVSPLSGGYTPGSDEGRADLHELMAIYTKLSDRVLDLVKEKDAQAMEILKLKNRIRKLKRKAKSSIPPRKRRLYKQVDSSDDSLGEENTSKQGRNNSNKTEEFNLSDKGSGGTKVFDDTTAAEKDVNAAEPVCTAGDVVTAASVILDIDIAGPSNVSAASFSISTAGDIFKDKMMTIADTLVAIRSTRRRTALVVIHDVEEEPRRATSVPTVQSQDKCKSKIVEPEPTPKNPIKAQIQKDAEIAQRFFEEDQA
ncbi:putative ribonuclease H-like domain-containing protein [Tanacetum coccineum]